MSYVPHIPKWSGSFIAPMAPNLLGRVGHIPGLKIGADLINGPLDAHAVAARRLGMEFIGPPRPVAPAVVDARLFDYQVEGVQLLEGIMRETGGALLTDEMGLGKSAQAIALAHKMGAMRVLVVCPASVRETWKEQLQRWAWKDAFIIDEGKKLDSIPSTGWSIISYELSSRIPEHYYPDLVIFDEVQLAKGRAFKGKGPLRVKAAKQLVSSSGARLLMTGTPMWDRPRDLWSLLDMTWPRRFGSAMEFDAAYCSGHFDAHGGWDNKGVASERLHELKHRLSMLAVSRTKEVVKDQLPDLTQNLVWLPPDKKSTDAFKRMLQRTGSVQEALEASLAYKEPAAVELALQARDFLLVTWLRASAQSLATTLNKHGTQTFLINGDVPHAKRQAIIKEAAFFKQQGKSVGIVATIDSLAAGVDGIQHITSNGIFHSFLQVPTVMAQTVARLYRLGQKNAVQWTWLGVRDSAEEPLVHHLVKKMEAQTRVTGGLSEMRNAFVDSEAEEAETLRALYEAM